MKSDTVKTGMQQTPHRSPFSAPGMTEEETRKPPVGIVSSYSEIVPGHTSLDKIVDAVKLGVTMAGGTPVVSPAIVVCDGIAMGHIGTKYSLATRGLIVDSMECMALAHQFDALVMVLNCDKNVPGLLVTAARIDVPTVFVDGGPILAGHVKGHKTSLFSMFEVVGAYAADNVSEEDVKKFGNKARSTCSSCSSMYTANSMNCLTKVLGTGLRGNGTVPTVYSECIKLTKYADMRVMEMYEKNACPRNIMTEEAFTNALTMDMALGCSTNSILYPLTTTHETGVELNVNITNEISARIPNLCHLAPAGPTCVEDLNEVGGIYATMKEASKKGLLSLDCMIVTGGTVRENIKGCVNEDPGVIRPAENPYGQTGGIAILKGNLAPSFAVVKRPTVASETLERKGPVRVFDREEDAIGAIKGSRTAAGDAVITHYKGPREGPGMREMFNPTFVIVGAGLRSTVALITDGRFPGTSRSASIDHASPEAVVGGPIALVEGGDIISIDIDNRKLNVLVSNEEMATRKAR